MRRTRGAPRSGQVLAVSVLNRIKAMARVRSAERGATEALSRALQWVPVTEPIAEEPCLLARRYRRPHGAIDVVDHVVASTQAHDAEVWTLNLEHFPMVEGLRPPY